MKRVLIVDDEQRVLAGLRRQLHARSGEWELLFLERGEAALAELASRPADVVVTDMRMPGMDGAQLLAWVAAEHPRTARLALSGQAEPERQVVARGCCHLYLVKPCPAEQLEAAIGQALEVRTALDALEWPEGQQLWNCSPMDEALTERLFRKLAGLGADVGAIDRVAALIESDARLSGGVEVVLGERAPAALQNGCAPRPLVALALAIKLRERVAGASDCAAAVVAAARARGDLAAQGGSREAVLQAATAVLLALPGSAHPGPARRIALEFLLPIWGFPEAVVAAAAQSPAPPPSPSAADRPHLLPSSRR